jgi:hypothetical protein
MVSAHHWEGKDWGQFSEYLRFSQISIFCKSHLEYWSCGVLQIYCFATEQSAVPEVYPASLAWTEHGDTRAPLISFLKFSLGFLGKSRMGKEVCVPVFRQENCPKYSSRGLSGRGARPDCAFRNLLFLLRKCSYPQCRSKPFPKLPHHMAGSQM